MNIFTYKIVSDSITEDIMDKYPNLYTIYITKKIRNDCSVANHYGCWLF